MYSQLDFDIDRMRSHYERSLRAGGLLQDEEAILFLGETGAGKSTTIHYLAGSKFEMAERSGIRYRSPVKLPAGNRHLREVTISPTAASETHHVMAVPVDFSQINPFIEGRVVLCDTPGFGDTAGVEVDVANGLALVEAMRRCKSVRLFVLVSRDEMGDRMQGVQRVAHQLLSLIPNIGDVFSSIIYGFTKYDEDACGNIPGQIQSICQEVQKQEGAEPHFKNMVEDINRKVRCGALIINDPLTVTDDQRSHLLRALMDTPAVREPAKIFEYMPSAEVWTAMKRQVAECQRSIEIALKKRDYPLVGDQLDQLAFMHKLFAREPFFREAYENGIKEVQTALNVVASQAESILQRCLQDDYPLRVEDTQVFQTALTVLETAQQNVKMHLDLYAPDMVGPGKLHQCLEKTLEELEHGIEEAEPRGEHVMIGRLEKLTLFKKLFPTGDWTHYDASVCMIIQKIQTGYSNGLLDAAVSSDDYQALGERLIALNRFILNLDDHSPTKSQGLQVLEKIREMTLQKIELAVSIDFLRNNDGSSDDHIVGQLKERARNLEAMTSCALLLEGMDPLEDKLKRLQASFWERLRNFFERKHRDINALYERQQQGGFKEIGRIIKNLETIRSISPIFCEETQEPYTCCTDQINEWLQVIHRSVEKRLSELFIDPEAGNLWSVDEGHDDVIAYLQWLKDAEWMRELEGGRYTGSWVDVGQKYVSILRQHLSYRLKTLQLDFPHHAHLCEAGQLYKALHGDALALSRVLPELMTLDTSVRSQLEERIGAVLSAIPSQFDYKLQLARIRHELQDEVDQLERQKKRYIALRNAQVRIREQDIADLEGKWRQRQQLQMSQESEITQVLTRLQEERKTFITHRDNYNRLSMSWWRVVMDKAAAYLLEHGLTKEGIEARISELEAEIGRQQLALQQLRITYGDSISRLEAVKNEYDSFSPNSSDAREDSVDLDLDDIKAKIASLQSDLKKDDAYFSHRIRLDYPLLWQALRYLEHVPPIEGLLVQVQRCKEKIDADVWSYLILLEGTASIYFKTLQLLLVALYTRGDNPLDRNECIDPLIARLDELMKIKQENKTFFEKYYAKSYERWCHELRELADLINIYSSTACDVLMIPSFPREEYLRFIQAMCDLDRYMDTRLFTQLYHQWNARIVSYWVNAGNKVQKCLKDVDYERLHDELHILNAPFLKNTNLARDTYDKVIGIVVRFARQEIEILFVRLIAADFHKVEGPCEIRLSLIRVNRLLGHINAFLGKDVQQELCESHSQIKLGVADHITKILRRVKAALEARDFIMYENEREILSRLTCLFSDILPEALRDDVNRLQDLLIGTLNNIHKKFKYHDLDRFYELSPKATLGALKRASSYNSVYTEKHNAIWRTIHDRLDEEIVKTMRQTDIQDLEKIKYHRIYSILHTVPDDLRDELLFRHESSFIRRVNSDTPRPPTLSFFAIGHSSLRHPRDQQTTPILLSP